MWRRLFAVLAAVVAASVLLGAAIAMWPTLAPSSSSPASPSAPVAGNPPASSSPPGGNSAGSNATTPPGNATGPPGNSTPPTNGTWSNLTLTIRLPKTTYAYGETVDYVVTVTNTGNTTLTFARSGCDPWLLVTNATGTAVYSLSGLLCPLVVTPVALAPGQSLNVTGSWLQIASMTGQQVPPGTYDLSAWWTVGVDLLQSNVVPIVILGG